MLPPGVGRKIPAGATIVWQMHYTPTGKEEKDRSQLGLIWRHVRFCGARGETQCNETLLRSVMQVAFDPTASFIRRRPRPGDASASRRARPGCQCRSRPGVR